MKPLAYLHVSACKMAGLAGQDDPVFVQNAQSPQPVGTPCVDNELAIYGIDGPHIADASIVPNGTSSSNMAPCAVIGERAADILRPTY